MFIVFCLSWIISNDKSTSATAFTNKDLLDIKIFSKYFQLPAPVQGLFIIRMMKSLEQVNPE